MGKCCVIRWFMAPAVLSVAVLQLNVYPVPAATADEEPGQAETAVDSVALSQRHLSWGQGNLNNGQFEDAEIQLTKAQSYDPHNHKTSYFLGKLYVETDRPEEAIRKFSDSITQNLEPKGADNKYYTNALYYVAVLSVRVQDIDRAIASYTQLVRLTADEDRKVDYIQQLISLHADKDEYEVALQLARQWGEMRPEDPVARDTIAKLAIRTGEEDEALAQMRKILDANPDDMITRATLADIYRRRGMAAEAFEAYERLLEGDPENFLYLEYLLELGLELKKPKRMRIDLLNRMLEIQPDNLAVIEQLLDETRSIRFLDRALGLDPQNGKFNYLKGERFFEDWEASGAPRDSVDALVYFRKALTDPQWQGNAQRMIHELDPPLTKEEKARRKFFKEKPKLVNKGQQGKK